MSYYMTISNSTVNAGIFSTYIRELCVHLRDEARMEGVCLIFDNTRTHKRVDIEQITSEFNFEYKFLSPYSYMLNPIENAFSKIKNGVRSGIAGGLSKIVGPFWDPAGSI